MQKKIKKSFSYHLFTKSNNIIENKKKKWKFPLIYNESQIFSERRSIYVRSSSPIKIQIISHKIKTKYRNPSQIQDLYQTMVKKLRICVSSPNRIRSICLRQSPEGFLIGRVWNARTIKYKTLKPIPGGLFCERAFGAFQRGICSCKRSQWRLYPKFPKKLGRFEISYCSYCSTQTIYPLYPNKNRKVNNTTFYFQWKIFSFFEKSSSKKKEDFSLRTKEAYFSGMNTLKFSQIFSQKKIEQIKLDITTCKCGKTKLFIHWFFSVFRACRFCIGSTRYPFYGKITTYWLAQEQFNSFSINKNQIQDGLILRELVGSEYQPGFCGCGRTSTEVQWDQPAFCGCCGTEISIEILPRRYNLGYLPLSTPVAHIWYYYYEPRPLPRLRNFSRRLFKIIIHCERIVAGEAYIHIKIQKQYYFSSEFQPKGYFTNFFLTHKLNFPIMENSFNIKPKGKDQGKKRALEFAKTKNKSYYSNIINVEVPEIEILTFPWYCFYRDNPFIQSFKKDKRENLELFNKLLNTNPKARDYLFNYYKKSADNLNLLDKEKMRITVQGCQLIEQPIRTGGRLVLNRLKTLNIGNWCLQGNQRLKILKKEINIIEKDTSQNPSKRSIYRNLIQIRTQILTRMRIMSEIRVAKIQPYWLIMQCFPILPPDLRPILSLGKEKIIVADVNTLYQRVIERNRRVAQRRRLIIYYKNHYKRDIYYHERLLQESLSCLFENTIKEKRRKKESANYKSLAEVLKGKRGRFRNNLLGKRVNYSGRSVIISGPELALHQCGLPREIILTLFQPFLIRFLLGRFQNGKKIRTRFQARKFIEEQTKERWNIRKHVLKGFPVLLNRAPTLHRFGFQAFQPQLIYQRVIQLHPLSCSGFNADFDGDQIAVHVPLSPYARSEAWRLIIPGSHFFSPATSDIVFAPSQDIVLGTYYLTTRRAFFSIFQPFQYLPGFVKNKKLTKHRRKWKSPMFFCRAEEVIEVFEKGNLNLEQFIWLYVQKSKIDCEYEFTTYERRLNRRGQEQKFSLWHWKRKSSTIILVRNIVGRIIFSYLFFLT